MAELLAPVTTRFVDVLERERGRSGLGPTAALRYVPAGRFRRSAGGQSLRDAGYPPNVRHWDRAYFLEYVGLADEPRPENPQNATALRIVHVNLLVGYVYGAGSVAAVARAIGTTEDPATAVANVRQRALSEADAVYSALGSPDIFQDITTDPVLIDCVRDGESTVEDLGGGRLLSVTNYAVTLEKSTTARYWPA